jgi:hypothetical protein
MPLEHAEAKLYRGARSGKNELALLGTDERVLLK